MNLPPKAEEIIIGGLGGTSGALRHNIVNDINNKTDTNKNNINRIGIGLGFGTGWATRPNSVSDTDNKIDLDKVNINQKNQIENKISFENSKSRLENLGAVFLQKITQPGVDLEDWAYRIHSAIGLQLQNLTRISKNIDYNQQDQKDALNTYRTHLMDWESTIAQAIADRDGFNFSTQMNHVFDDHIKLDSLDKYSSNKDSCTSICKF